MPGEKRHIKLNLYDTTLSVNAPVDDEEYYRKAAKLITERVNLYAQTFDGRKGKEDILYMAMLDIALRLEKQSEHNDTAPFMDILGKLTTEIEDTLKKK